MYCVSADVYELSQQSFELVTATYPDPIKKKVVELSHSWVMRKIITFVKCNLRHTHTQIKMDGWMDGWMDIDRYILNHKAITFLQIISASSFKPCPTFQLFKIISTTKYVAASHCGLYLAHHSVCRHIFKQTHSWYLCLSFILSLFVSCARSLAFLSFLAESRP